MSLYRRKDSKVWWMSLAPNGRRERISTGTENKKLAVKIHAKALTDIESGRWFENQAKKKALKEMIDRYEKEYSEHKDYYQMARDKSIFKNLYSFFGNDASLEDVESIIGSYEQHRRAQGAKPGTIVKELGLLRRMFNIARKQWKWKIANPVSDIELPRINNKRVRYLQPEEYQRLFDVLETSEEKWLYAMVTVALETGLRLSNVCNLTWPEVKLFSRIIEIDAEKTKNKDYLGIPLTDRAYETLKELQKVKCISNHVFHVKGQRIYPRKLQRAFTKACRIAKLEDFHFHDLRHTFASYLRQRGVDLDTISKLLGHKDLRMTKRYSHLSVESLRDAISRLNVTFWSRSEGAEGATCAVTP
jgi:integrase